MALVGLRLKLEVRGLSRTRERAMGFLLMVPGLLIFAGIGSFVMFFGVRGLSGAAPEAVLPSLSAAATLLGVFWSLSPLLSGVAFSEAHDMSRLLHFPIPLRTLAASSLLANIAQPMALSALPILAALALALAGGGARFPAAALGAASTFVFILAAAQVVGLVLHGLTRRRRFRDLALFLGLGFGFALSLGPVLLLSGARPVRTLIRALVQTPLLAVSPFAWGVRAAVHAGRGEWLPFAANAGAEALAVVAAVGVAALLLQRIYRGEVDLGQPSLQAGQAARMWTSGALGALLEKDLRMTWRDPAQKATLIMGLMGPLLFLVFLSQTRARGGAGTGFLLLATFVGISAFGSNAFGLERRGIALLLGFPVERWRILAGKNAGAIALRLGEGCRTSLAPWPNTMMPAVSTMIRASSQSDRFLM